MPGMIPQRGTALLVLLLSLWLAINLGRRVLPASGNDSPAVVFAAGGMQVMFGEGFADAGVHQFSDALTPADVIKMAQTVRPVFVDGDPRWHLPLVPGERLDLIPGSASGLTLRRSFMTAEARINLAIPLHPDLMSRDDWQALPGVGEKLATAIMQDRQKNGDFGSLEGVTRVKGVGSGRLRSWRPFF
ncbi:MAG: hypothetical protein A2091_09780 [Desulfuromonadales bacterium GWD2_61_12]|nr:MAG: hypothetical protein A2005_04665 [Desulfuromonadales bacterium GWC2_61_20]OGR32397.1 MAG: hypothetical protein A2091_09780 [Desulfuromonadales bacterium GWD2_61_12]HAD04365.1 hypothetical protein [Desulfuromonas sp.]HBT83332.1 hypothetical protein [Desulfuromonas sp.]